MAMRKLQIIQILLDGDILKTNRQGHYTESTLMDVSKNVSPGRI